MSKRSEQVSEVIRRELNEFIIRGLEPPKDLLITITKIETSEDLKHTQIFASILPINKTGTAIRFLNNNLGRMRHFLTQKLKLFHIPELKIIIDGSALKARKIERELEKLGE